MYPEDSKYTPGRKAPSAFTNKISQALQKLEEQRSDKPGYTVRKIAKQLRQDYEDDPRFEMQIRFELQRMAETGRVVRNTHTKDVWKRCADKHIVKAAGRQRFLGQTSHDDDQCFQEELSNDVDERFDNDCYKYVGGVQPWHVVDDESSTDLAVTSVHTAASRTTALRDSPGNLLVNPLESVAKLDARCLAMSKQLVKNYVSITCSTSTSDQPALEAASTSTQRQTRRPSTLKRTHSHGDQEGNAGNKSPRKSCLQDDFEKVLKFEEAEVEGGATEREYDDQSNSSDAYNYDLDEFSYQEVTPDEWNRAEDNNKKQDGFCYLM